MRPEDADLAIAEWPAIVEVGSDPATVQIDGLVAGGGIDPTTEVDLPQAVLVTPAFDQRVDVLVVEGQGLGLDEPVLLAPAGVAGMDVVDVQATVDVLHAAVDERPTEDVLVVKDRPCGVVAADPPVEIGAQTRTWFGANRIFENDAGDGSKATHSHCGWPSQANGRYHQPYFSSYRHGLPSLISQQFE